MPGRHKEAASPGGLPGPASSWPGVLDKPSSVGAVSLAAAMTGMTGGRPRPAARAAISLAPPLPTGSGALAPSAPPGPIRRADGSVMDGSIPEGTCLGFHAVWSLRRPPSPANRCALTAPSHPCLCPMGFTHRAIGGLVSSRPRQDKPCRGLPHGEGHRGPGAHRPFTPPARQVGVAHHRALPCSDFPRTRRASNPGPCARGRIVTPHGIIPRTRIIPP